MGSFSVGAVPSGISEFGLVRPSQPKAVGGLRAPNAPTNLEISGGKPVQKKTAKAGASGSVTIPQGNAVNVKGPDRPTLPEINPQAEFDPTLQAYAAKYGTHLSNLEAGTGEAMDVLRAQQEEKKNAELEKARASAAAAGIPFDEGGWAAEWDRGINNAMAQEKINREQMLTSAYSAGLPIVSQPSSERLGRLGLDLQRDMGEAGNVLDLYKADISKYGTDVQAAVGSNNALLGFLQSMMGAFGNMGSSLSTGGNSYYYG